MNKMIVPVLFFIGAFLLWVATAITLYETIRGK